jgi:hypothetical protein
LAQIINKTDAPSHLFSIPELDFSEDLFAQPLAGPWVRLAARTLGRCHDRRGVEEEVSRQSLLILPEQFVTVFNKLESIGNVLRGLGKPSGSVSQGSGPKEYIYAAFHRFEFPFTTIVGEPLVFAHRDSSGVQLFINPDLWLFFELEEKTPGGGIWWDPRRGVDVLLRRTIERGSLQTVEIRSEYILKYLRARQMSLLVGHYRQLLLFGPSQDKIGAFVEGNLTLGSPEQGAKAILQNWGLRQDAGRTPFLQRRLHLWFEIKPPPLDVEDPWAEEPPFDPYTFTLLTTVGPVAPARWKDLRHSEEQRFAGVPCDFMEDVYFRQDVLTKYEGAAGFDVGDDGSVSCRHHWGLVRSTGRLGNELLYTAIGDFAEGVPFEEWPHWKQYAVEPPSPEIARALGGETPIPEAVNSLAKALLRFNTAFTDLAASLGVGIVDPPWRGALDSLAGRQLKWVYPATADDDEFLKRATLISTFLIDGLHPASLRKLLNAVGRNLHETFGRPSTPLASRNLLQRVTLMTLLIEAMQPRRARLAKLVKQAEGKPKNQAGRDLQVELEGLHKQVRSEFAPLAFLYDLRTHGGLAHRPHEKKARAAAVGLGLPEGNWHRTDYLCLLNLIAESLNRISEHFEVGAQMAREMMKPGQ